MIFKLSRSSHGTHNNGQGIIFTIELRFVEPWEGTID